MMIDEKSLKWYAALKGLTMQELAEISNVSNVTISRVLNGHNRPSVKTLRNLARSLEVDVVDILIRPED